MNKMTTENQNKWAGWMIAAGMLVMAVMAVMPLLNFNYEWMRWGFAAGSALVLAGRVLDNYKGESLRIKRLHRILIASAIIYCASALMMFLSRGTNDWIGFLLAGLVTQLYATWMIELEMRKSGK